MKYEDIFLDKVVKKTNVNKGEILKLANDLQTKDLNNENDIREFILSVAIWICARTLRTPTPFFYNSREYFYGCALRRFIV